MEGTRRCASGSGKKITEFLEQQAYAELDSYAPKPVADGEIVRAIQAWNLLGGLEWDGLLLAAEVIGFDDIEMLISKLSAIRDFNEAQRAQMTG